MLNLRDFADVPGTNGDVMEGPGGIRLEWNLINQHDCTSGWMVRGAGRELAQERFQSAARAVEAINAARA